MTRVVSFIIQKGGCGKTTSTANTAGYLSMQGYKILCVDMDPQGNLTQHLGYDAESLTETIIDLFEQKLTFDEVVLKREVTLHLLPNNLRTEAAEPSLLKSPLRDYLLRDLIFPLTGKYDFVLIDCPPTLGLFSINALAASHEFVLVVSPEFLPMKAIKPLYGTFRRVKFQLNHSLQFNGLVMTMCDFRTRHNQEIYKILKRNFPHKLYKSYIRNNVSLKEAASQGKTIFEYHPHSLGAFDYQNFAEEFIREQDQNISKRHYYQKKYESLQTQEKERIIMLAKKNLTNFIKESFANDPQRRVYREALLVERNKILEKRYPYRAYVLGDWEK